MILNTVFGKIEMGIAYQRSLLNMYKDDALNGRWNLINAELGYYF